MKRIYTLLAGMLAIAGIQAQQPEAFRVHFESADWRLSKSDRTKLGDFLKTYSGWDSVVVCGHTDSEGSEDYNLELSRKRAEEVSDALEEMGVSGLVRGFSGETEPVAENTDAAGKRANRRVEVVVYGGIQGSTGKKKVAQEEWTLEKLRKSLMPEEEVHCIDNRRDTALLLRKGMVVVFPAYCFESYDPFRCVEIRATEAHRRSDMVLAGLSTESDGKMLASGGMVRVLAMQDERELRMREDKPAGFLMPDPTPEFGMQLFYSDHKDINWKPSGRAGGGLPVWDRESWSRNRRSMRRIPCPFLFCRIRRAFIPKGEREPLVFQEFEFGGSWYSEQNMEDLKEVFQEEDLDRLNEKIEAQQQALATTTYYAFKSSRLGWINCDYFYDQPASNLIVASSSADEKVLSSVSMVFRGAQDMVMAGDGILGEVSFTGVPEKREVLLIGIGVKDGEPCVAMKECDIAQDMGEMEYRESNPAEIKKMVESSLR